MASSSNIFAAPLLNYPISEKLAKNNLGLWKMQVLPAIRGAQLKGFLDGIDRAPPATVDEKKGDKTMAMPNPEYARWVALD